MDLVENKLLSGFGANLMKYVTQAEAVTSPPALIEIIKQTLEAPSVYVFGEMLDLAQVKALEGTEHEPYLRLLKIFAYNSYQDYVRARTEKPESLPELTPAMANKLRHLSVVTLSRSRRHIPYDMLMRELDVSTVRELEDLIIEVIYANVIRGRMDQKENYLEIDQTIGRDVRLEDLDSMSNVLNEWCRTCDAILSNIEQQISVANSIKEKSTADRVAFETQILEIRKKSTPSMEIAEPFDTVHEFMKFDKMDKEKTKRQTRTGFSRLTTLRTGSKHTWVMGQRREQ